MMTYQRCNRSRFLVFLVLGALACLLAPAACGMRSGLTARKSGDVGGAPGDGGSTMGVAGSGGTRIVTLPPPGGSAGTSLPSTFGGATGAAAGRGGSGGSITPGSGGIPGRGGSDAGAGNDARGDASAGNDARNDARNDGSPDSSGSKADAAGTPTINPNSGYLTLTTGNVTMSGYVSSYMGGSGSTVTLTYDATSFCSVGSVAPSSTYNSWAGAGFNVNQAQSGSSGSTGQLVLNGSSASITYVNKGGSTLEFQLWDGSDYWCYQLPTAKTATTIDIPFSKLNTQCWNNGGTTFQSGTPITAIQLVVPGAAFTPVPFDYCFLGLTIK